MTLSEFKAWFEGFTENMDRLPTKKQWARITKRVDEITEVATPWPIFVNRHVRPYTPYWIEPTIGPVRSFTATSSPNLQQSVASNDVRAMFTNAGRAEYKSISA